MTSHTPDTTQTSPLSSSEKELTSAMGMAPPTVGFRPALDPRIEACHQQACQAQESMYQDPFTGLMVMTAHYLNQRPCCQAGCRHCPHGFWAVGQA